MVDLWSMGCIMAELIKKKVLFDGRVELEQLQKIFAMLGAPTEQTWPGWSKLKGAKLVRTPVHTNAVQNLSTAVVSCSEHTHAAC